MGSTVNLTSVYQIQILHYQCKNMILATVQTNMLLPNLYLRISKEILDLNFFNLSHLD